MSRFHGDYGVIRDWPTPGRHTIYWNGGPEKGGPTATVSHPREFAAIGGLAYSHPPPPLQPAAAWPATLASFQNACAAIAADTSGALDSAVAFLRAEHCSVTPEDVPSELRAAVVARIRTAPQWRALPSVLVGN